jgi:hypothetical protein
MTNPPNMLQSRAIRSREFENIMVFAGIKKMSARTSSTGSEDAGKD